VAAVAEEDHRVRTGAIRREQTRRRLLASAMQVFAEKGADAAVIDDFIAAAGVARGTFYNYFSTTQELLDAVTSELSDAILAEIDKVVVQIDDPLQRLATGCLLYMHLGVDLPNWGAFVMRTGFRSEAIGKLVDIYMPRDIEMASRAGELSYPSLRAARDLMFSCVSQAILTVNAGQAPREHLRQMLSLGLRGVGAKPALADRLSTLPLPVVILPPMLSGGSAG
jgi:AcrR family transcriptional regulator